MPLTKKKIKILCSYLPFLKPVIHLHFPDPFWVEGVFDHLGASYLIIAVLSGLFKVHDTQWVTLAHCIFVFQAPGLLGIS